MSLVERKKMQKVIQKFNSRIIESWKFQNHFQIDVRSKGTIQLYIFSNILLFCHTLRNYSLLILYEEFSYDLEIITEFYSCNYP